MSQKTAFILNENDALVLRQMVSEFKSRFKNQNNRPRVTEELGQTPEVYIARTPDTGIAALTATVGTATASLDGDTVGSAECAIYRILDNALQPISVAPQTVYNLSPTAVAKNIWTPVARDKFGSWLCVFQPASAPSALVTGETIGTGGNIGVDDTWTSVGTTYVLPDAGTYQFTIRATGWVLLTALSGTFEHGYMWARIFDSTNSAIVPGSTVLATEGITVGEYAIRTFVTGGRLTVTGATNLRLQGFLESVGATYNHGACGFDLSHSVQTLPVFDWIKVG